MKICLECRSISNFNGGGDYHFCPTCNDTTEWEEIDKSTSNYKTTTYTTVEFCEKYQHIHRKNIDWDSCLTITRTGGMDNCPRHKATFKLDEKVVEFEDYLPKKEVKAKAIALWQSKYSL